MGSFLVILYSLFFFDVAKSQYNCKIETSFDPDSLTKIPSWCEFVNPFSSIPEHFYTNFPNITLNIEEMCDMSDILSECRAVVDIQYVEFSSEKKFVLFFLRDGKVIYSDYSSYNLTILVDIGENVDEVSLWKTLDTRASLILVTSTQRIYYFQFDSGDLITPASTQLCKIESIDPKTYSQITDVRMIRDIGTGLWFTLFQFELDSSSASSNAAQKRYQLHFKTFNGTCPSKESEITTMYTWDVKPTTGATFLGFDILTHDVNFDHANPSLFAKEAAGSRNVLLLLFDDFQVKLVGLKLRDNVQLDFEAVETQMATFWDARVSSPADGRITNANVIGYEIRRLDFEKSSCGHYVETESQVLSLVVVEFSPFSNTSFVRVVELREFFEQVFHGEINMTNPANRVFYCPLNQYYNKTSQKCIDRVAKLDIVLDMKIWYSRTVFVSSIVELGSEMDRHLNMEYVCDYFLSTGLGGSTASHGKNRELLKECVEYDETKYQCDADKLKQNEHIRQVLFSYVWYANIFLAGERKVAVYSYGYDLDDVSWYFKEGYFLNPTTLIHAKGAIESVSVSRNSYYFFVAITRETWELISQDTTVKMCEMVSNGEFDEMVERLLLDEPELGNEIMQSMREACMVYDPHPSSFNMFAEFISSCPHSVHCLSMSKSVAENVEAGYYSLKPFFKEECPPGYYCVGGDIIPCPAGMFCPHFKTKIPSVCQPDDNRFTTCNIAGAIFDEIVCPPGSICTTKHGRPIEIPPGYKQYLPMFNMSNVTDIKEHYEEVLYMDIENTFEPCVLGEWCPLGMFFNNPCPMGTWCEETGVLKPEQCTYIMPNRSLRNGYSDYCPQGTYEARHPCPAGYFCNVVNRSKCTPLESGAATHCPEGSLIERACPPGTYCPRPNVSVECPRHYFCSEGVSIPKRCSLFSICPPGQSINMLNLFNVFLIGLIFVGVYILYWMLKLLEKWVKKWQRKKRLKKHALLLESTGETNTLSDQKSDIEERFTIDLAFEKLRLELKSNGKAVVNNVTGLINHGKVTAVMGLSGCGKTSIITALSGKAYYGNTSGDIFVNGTNTPLSKLKKMVAFVPQDDIMYRTMTVEETLTFAATTRAKRGTDVKRKVEETLSVLGLEHISGSLIGDENIRGISGGQRKRVNIGIELVAEPLLLFLDEPTSGLDSASSQETCDALKEIARCGINVITVIHQPRYEIFSQFDNLLLLARGGFVIYSGPVPEAEQYFEKLGYVCPNKVNPADFFLDVVSGRVADVNGITRTQEFFIEYWKNHMEPPLMEKIREMNANASDETFSEALKLKLSKELKTRKRSFFVHFWESLKRACVMRFRDLKGFYLDSALLIFGGLILGALFSGDTSSPMQILKQSMMISLLLSLCAVMGSLPTFGSDKAVFIREHSSGLMSLCHYLAFNIVDLFSNIVGPLLFCCILFFLASPKAHFGMYYLISFATHFTTYGLGYPVSIAFGQNSRIASIVILVIFNLLSGLVEPLPTMREWIPPICYFPYASYILYATEAFDLIEVHKLKSLYGSKIDELLEKQLMYKFDHIYYNIPLIFAFGILFRIVGFVCLTQIYPPDSFSNKCKSFVSKYTSLFKIKVSEALVNCCCGKKKKKKQRGEGKYGDLRKGILDEKDSSINAPYEEVKL